MKVLGINGSPHKDGNTSLLIKEVFKVLEAEGIETEFYQLGGKQVHGCTACGKCRELKDGKCHIKNDAINECIPKMNEADAIIIGSPVYFANVTTEIKALIDCAGYVTRSTHSLKRKIGAGVVAVRRAGEIFTFNSINDFFLISQMIVPGSSYWNVGIGKLPGDVLKDEEGMQTMRHLGENMAWLLKKVCG
ncbi:MAG: flavodoxin family protein [Salinivirgaceae bacterium]|jgi:multimeric flavodoxin WrbA|nr:flavodoxin family protein [Salinivirgaceae bacterium]